MQQHDIDRQLEQWDRWARYGSAVVQRSDEFFVSRVQDALTELESISYTPARGNYPSDDDPPPPSGDLALGPFGVFASWLIRTRSLPPTLITGMIGIGTLGAAISSFVRDARRRKPGEPLVSDLAGVIIRAVSAAIIIFLAVSGGLAVFVTGDTEPNAYALFFACLLGAVFSESVWEWARDRFMKDLKRGDGGDDQGDGNEGPRDGDSSDRQRDDSGTQSEGGANVQKDATSQGPAIT